MMSQADDHKHANDVTFVCDLCSINCICICLVSYGRVLLPVDDSVNHFLILFENNENVTLVEANHNHDACHDVKEKVVRHEISNSGKRKALENKSERPSKILVVCAALHELAIRRYDGRTGLVSLRIGTDGELIEYENEPPGSLKAITMDARTCKLVSKSETEVTGGQEGRKEARRTGNMCPGVELTDEGMYGLCLRVVSKMTPSQVPKRDDLVYVRELSGRRK
ncbi:hypothetical protein ANN_10707 [Periplaneta americana]|uniref:Uncharacterized protein n=1 Tax=Periplaneta americana TaxID=6978 RepID=A0ABQ8T308_PERAM|nr:hypothetical protein ANN_10707 [Periplaneta americana]